MDHVVIIRVQLLALTILGGHWINGIFGQVCAKGGEVFKNGFDQRSLSDPAANDGNAGQNHGRGKSEKGVDMIVAFRDKVPAEYQTQTSPFINGMLTRLAAKKQGAGLTVQEEYIKEFLPK